MSGSCSASCVSARWSAALSASCTGRTAVSSVGGGKLPLPVTRGIPRGSPIRTSRKPQTFAISPAPMTFRCTTDPPSNPASAVTFSSPSRSRTRIAPEKSRAYAILWPASSRSILNTVPERGSSSPPVWDGSSSGIPAISSWRPSPRSAEPAKTGWTIPPRVCAASARRSCSSSMPRPSTYAARSSSSFSASTGRRSPSTGTTAGVSRSLIEATTRSGSAPSRSILLTKKSVGTRSRSSARHRSGVWACTPSTAETTSTAPSSTARTRSTSAMKSGWPGVSIRLTVTSPIANVATAVLIVIPRCCSSASVSVCVVPLSTLPSSWITPAACSSRSVSVVLPASTCARIPKLSVRRSILRTSRFGHKGPCRLECRCAHEIAPWSLTLGGSIGITSPGQGRRAPRRRALRSARRRACRGRSSPGGGARRAPRGPAARDAWTGRPR